MTMLCVTSVAIGRMVLEKVFLMLTRSLLMIATFLVISGLGLLVCVH